MERSPRYTAQRPAEISIRTQSAATAAAACDIMHGRHARNCTRYTCLRSRLDLIEIGPWSPRRSRTDVPQCRDWLLQLMTKHRWRKVYDCSSPSVTTTFKSSRPRGSYRQRTLDSDLTVRNTLIFNPLIATLKPQSNDPSYSNTVIGTLRWPLMGGLLNLVQRGGDWAGPQLAQAHPRCTKCNSQGHQRPVYQLRIVRCGTIIYTSLFAK